MIYYHHNPESGSWAFETLAAAMASAQTDVIENYEIHAHEDGWPDDVAYISVYKCAVPTEHPHTEGLLVALALEIILEEEPTDLDEEGFSADLDDHWNSDFDYLCEYVVTVVDAVVRADRWAAGREQALAEMRRQAAEQNDPSHARDLLQTFERYLTEALSELAKVKRLTQELGAETVPSNDD